MLRVIGIPAAVLLTVVVVGVVAAANCSQFWTATLTVRNESRQPVEIRAESWGEATIDPDSSRTLKLGLLWGRWNAPGAVVVNGRSCAWSEVKDNEPLVVTDEGPQCRDIYPDLPEGFDP